MKYVLIVEDELMTRKLISQIVKSLGYVPILSSNGRRALDVLSDNPQIKVVMTDYQMPEMDGIELIKKIKEDPKISKTSILVFSAYIRLSQISELFELGAEAFLNKPISKREIEEYLSRVYKV